MDYKEINSTLSVKKWQRANQVVIQNELNQAPRITFYEQTVTQIPGQPDITTSVSSISDILEDPTASFPLVDQSTGNIIGSMTHGELYVAIASLYLSLAMARDAASAQAAL